MPRLRTSGSLHLLTYILTYIIIYLLIYTLTYLFTYIHIYLLTYLLTSWSRVLLEKLTVFQLFKKLPTFYGTRRFITTFISARHLSISWGSSIQSKPPHPTAWRSILMLSYHLRLSSKWSLSLRFPHQNPAYASPIPHTCHMPRPSYSSRYYHLNNIWWGVQIIKLLVMYISPLPCY
jgi:hypothetical protein